MGRFHQTQGSRATTRAHVYFKHHEFLLLISPTSEAWQATQIWSHLVVLSREPPGSVNQHLKHWSITPKLYISLKSTTFKSQDILLESTSKNLFNKVIHDLIIHLSKRNGIEWRPETKNWLLHIWKISTISYFEYKSNYS